MSWTSGSKQSLNMLYLSKYLYKSFETQDITLKVFEKLVAIVILSVPDPCNGFHDMKHNSAIACQNQLEFLDQKA